MKNTAFNNKVIFISVFLIMIYYRGYCAAGESITNELDSLINKIESYIDNHHPDSAFNLCLMARSRGLSKEKLYLLLADIYIEKTKYDSALVFNYGAGALHKESSLLPITILKQRHSIYSSLGWNQKAKSLSDTLLLHPAIKRKNFLPEIRLKTGGGYKHNDITSYDVYPWIENDSVEQERGGFYDAQFKALWRFPNYRREKFNIAIEGSFEKPYWQEKVGNIDSLYYFLGANLGVKNIPKPLSVGIGSGIKRYRESSVYWKNNLNASIIKSNMFQLWFLNIYYNVDLNSSFDIENQSVGLISSNNLFLNKKWGLNFLLSMSGYFSETTENSIFLDVLYVSKENGDVTYYADSTFSEEIESSGISGIQLIKTIYESAGTVEIYNNMPQSRYSLSTELEFNYEINKVIKTGITLGGGLVRYPDEYSWIKTDTTAFSSSLLAFNKGDQKYYVFKQEPLVDIFNLSEPISEDIADIPLLYEKHHYDRTVYRLRTSIDFQFKVNKFGRININTEIGKEWNSSSIEYPISLNDWYVSILLKWQKSFKISRYAIGL